MRISNLRLERTAESARVVAAVQWEDCAREPLELFFETDSRGARDLSPEPEAFLTACALPAMREGERRILLEGPICPRFAAGIAAAVALLRSWYGPPRQPVAIEATRGFREIVPRRPARSAFFFTAGVDSTHLLQSNRAFYRAEHPDAFADCLSAFGHLCATDDRSRSWNEAAGRNIAAAAQEEGLGFLPIRNNVWDLAPDVEFLAAESLASAIASSAHLFRTRWSTISFASGRDSARQPLRGTHPLLDPLYGSRALEIRHCTNPYTRFERLQAIAASPRRLRNLVVCLAFPGPPNLNCGECEKCVRTMAALLAIGKLSHASQFPARDVRPESIRAVPIGEHDADYWMDFLPLLAARGRRDLVCAIEDKLEEGRRLKLWYDEAGWKGRLRRWDRRFLGGGLVELRRRASPRRAL